MFFRGKRAWRVWLVVLALVVVGVFAYAQRFNPEAEDIPGQRARLAGRTPATAPAKVDAPMLVVDFRTLSSPAMEGRGAGTPGGARARAYVLERYREIGLAPAFGTSFEQPFDFTPGRGIRFWRSAFWAARAPIHGVNVVGRIDGTAVPGKCLVISAHYDHLGVRAGKVYLGADDNASGLAALLAAATWFKAHPPRHCLLFAAFDAEEKGLRGAKAFVAAPPVPLGAIVVNINLDMVSRSDKDELFVAGLHANPQLRAPLDRVRATAAPAILYGHDHPRPVWDSDDWTGSSDHGAFAAKDVPWLYLGVEDHPDYHRPTDAFEKVDLRFYTGVADAIVDVVAAIDAMPDERIARTP